MKLSYSICLALALFILLSPSLLANDGFTGRDKRQLKRILATFSPHSTVALVIQPLLSKTPLFAHQGQKTIVPASTMKVVTALTALDGLGRHKRFLTQLVAAGPIVGGQLKGSLIIVGGGDPSLGMAKVEGGASSKEVITRWVNILKKRGIREVTGDIVGEATLFIDQPISRYAIWEDIGNYYGGVTSPLSWNGNRYLLYLSSQKKPGSVVRVLGTDPVHTAISTFDNRLRAGQVGSGDNAYIFGSPMSAVRYLTGTIPPGRKSFTIKGSLPNPAFTCAATLYHALKKEGITIRGRPCSTNRIKRRKGNHILDTYASPTLTLLVRHMNKTSDNVFAEQLLKLLALKFKSQGSRTSGLLALKERLEGLEIPLTGTHFKDGSGLSRYNGLTANFLTQCLCAAAKKPYYKALMSSMPISGVDGSLKRRYGDPKLKGRIIAKTGYMERVFALTGFVKKGQKRKTYAFTFVVNDETAPFSVIQQRFQQIAHILVK